MRTSAAVSGKERVIGVLEILDKTYPKVSSALNWHDPWELLVAVILSAQTTDDAVNRATPKLFARFPGPTDLLDVSPDEFVKYISTINFLNNKTRAVLGAAKMVVERFGGEVPRSMDEITQLAGIGRKSASAILSTAFGINEGIAVDTHVRRVSYRLGFTKETDVAKIEKDLMVHVPRDRWGKFAHQLTWHGRLVCAARAPKCKQCPLRDACPAFTFYTKEANEFFEPGDWTPPKVD